MLDHVFGEFERVTLSRSVRPATGKRALDCFTDFHVLVTEKERAPRKAKIDVFISIDVFESNTVRRFDKHRCATYAAEAANRRVDSARYDFFGTFKVFS